MKAKKKQICDSISESTIKRQERKKIKGPFSEVQDPPNTGTSKYTESRETKERVFTREIVHCNFLELEGRSSHSKTPPNAWAMNQNLHTKIIMERHQNACKIGVLNTFRTEHIQRVKNLHDIGYLPGNPILRIHGNKPIKKKEYL